MTILNLPGRVLLMVDDPDLMRRQLASEVAGELASFEELQGRVGTLTAESP
jgi:hypothetical protein